jgi:hypothetical protein
MSTKQIQKSIELLQELVDTNNSIIYNLINSGKSHDITEIMAKKYGQDFHKLSKDCSKISSIEQCIKLFDYVGIDPLKFVNLTKSKFRMDIQDKPIEDIEYFLNFATNKVDGVNFKSPLEFIEEITYNYSFKLLNIWSDEDTKNLDKFRLIWTKGNEHLRNELLQSSDLIDDNHKSTLDLLKQLKPDGLNLMEDLHRINHYYFRTHEIKNMSDMAFHIELLELHDELSKTCNKQAKRVKI